MLITGGCGFVGAFAALELASHGHSVVCFDRRAERNDVLEQAGSSVSVVEGDVLDRERLDAAVGEHAIEGVVHAAAVIGQQDGAADPEWMLRINLGGTVNVLEIARVRHLRLVYISTATLYGQQPGLQLLSEDARPEPVGMYDTSKLMAETLAITYHKVYGLDVVALRPGYVYGHHTSTGGYFLDRVFRGEVIDQPVGADLPIDVTYVRDLAQGIHRALTVRPIQSRIFNITGGALRRRGEVAEIARSLVPSADIRLGPGILPSSHLRGASDLSRARRELGYEPAYSLEKGMADWLEWLRGAGACGQRAGTSPQ
ncbi:MAG: NAD(P)-dependent oxidoreductase [Chloroflexota bacterium]